MVQGINISKSAEQQTQEVHAETVLSPSYLFQQFIRYYRQQVADCERSTMRSKADPDWSVIQNSPIQLSFCNLCQRSGFLEDRRQKSQTDDDTPVWYITAFIKPAE